MPTAAHVDRGFLHAIVASPVAGLELYDQGTWRAPHEIWPDLQEHGDVVILANDELARVSCMPGWSGGKIEACVHRVVNSTNTPRLSISYELRPGFHDSLTS